MTIKIGINGFGGVGFVMMIVAVTAAAGAAARLWLMLVFRHDPLLRIYPYRVSELSCDIYPVGVYGKHAERNT